MTDHDAEADAIVAVLEAAGLIAVEVRADGEESYVLTPDGERVARQLAMSRVASRTSAGKALTAQAPPR